MVFRSPTWKRIPEEITSQVPNEKLALLRKLGFPVVCQILFASFKNICGSGTPRQKADLHGHGCPPSGRVSLMPLPAVGL